MSYISSLNLLTDDSPVPLSEEALNEELALWANAQFTFDTNQNTAVHNDPYKSISEQPNLFASFSGYHELDTTNTQANNNLNSNTLINSYGSINSNTTNFFFQETPIQESSRPQSSATPLQQPQSQPQSQFHLHKQQNPLPRLAPAPTPQKTANNVVLSQPLSPLSANGPNNTYNLSSPSTSSLSSPRQLATSVPTNLSNKKRKTLVKDRLTEEDKEAIEEDKRRRNTAASARFRMKKKLREQALERTAREMTLKAETLEKRVVELEKEVKWLRALVIEKDPSLLPNRLQLN
ncbi:hypothetical protein BDF20DRAFT_911593 [Mycotypha africana]|uniref:uncharacterized protein n=1 Tax=Mycotypha africana TaxID=64632 RepID=UPI002300905D|nr:uncharacterized protein BDF20DRAFT_911593 [Mycotypha africana]KAI8984499.1 hypothetical protein BDF20DRAFT_911593 [Mycotypha africana]